MAKADHDEAQAELTRGDWFGDRHVSGRGGLHVDVLRDRSRRPEISAAVRFARHWSDGL